MTRQERIERVTAVRAALRHYVGHTEPDTIEAQDMITDLLLLVATEGVDIDECVRLARCNAVAEWDESELE